MSGTIYKYLLIYLVYPAYLALGVNLDSLENLAMQPGPEQKNRLIKLAGEYWRVSPQKAIKFAEQALRLIEIDEEPETAGEAYNIIGLGYELQGNFDRAVLNYQLAEGYFAINKNYKKLLDVYNNMGLSEKTRGNYESALNYFKRARTIADTSGDRRGLSKMLNNIGLLYYAWERYDDALMLFNESLEIKRTLGDSLKIANTLSNIANIYSEMGYDSLAIEYDLETIGIFRRLGDSIAVSKSYNNIGHNYSKMGLYEKALEFYKLSLKIKRATNDPLGRAITLQNIAEIQKKRQSYNEALGTLTEALGVVYNNRLYSIKPGILRDISAIHKELGDYQLALSFFEEASAAKDSMFKLKVAKELENMKVKYETDKKDQEIKYQETVIVQKEEYIILLQIIIGMFIVILLISAWFIIFRTITNRKLRILNSELTELNKELTISRDKLHKSNLTKDRFFSILAHDLINPVNIFLSLTSYMKEYYDRLEADEIRESINDLNKSSRNLYLLLENLLHWSRAQSGRLKVQKAFQNINSITSEIVDLLKKDASIKEIKIKNSVPSDVVAFCDKNMISTVLRNLATNAIKFTDVGGEVEIDAKENSPMINISVLDNGIGITKEDQEKLFRIDISHTTIGTSNEKGSGLGLILCKEFVELNEGNIDVESKPGLGTRFTITLPKKPSKNGTPSD